MGTPLELELLTPMDSRSQAIASGVASSLAICGIKVTTTALPFSELYAPGPEGRIFGRSFDLALISWQYSLAPACYLHTTTQIPNNENHWIGGNVTGYSRADFDIACSGLQRAISDDGDYDHYLQKAVEYFLTDLPAIPLFKQPRLVLSRQNLCAFTLNTYARSDLAGVELFDFSPDCD